MRWAQGKYWAALHHGVTAPGASNVLLHATMFLPQADASPPLVSAYWESIFLIASHALFVPSIPFLLWYRQAYLAAWNLAVLIFSVIYHSCLADLYCFGLSLNDA